MGIKSKAKRNRKIDSTKLRLKKYSLGEKLIIEYLNLLNAQIRYGIASGFIKEDSLEFASLSGDKLRWTVLLFSLDALYIDSDMEYVLINTPVKWTELKKQGIVALALLKLAQGLVVYIETGTVNAESIILAGKMLSFVDESLLEEALNNYVPMGMWLEVGELWENKDNIKNENFNDADDIWSDLYITHEWFDLFEEKHFKRSERFKKMGYFDKKIFELYGIDTPQDIRDFCKKMDEFSEEEKIKACLDACYDLNDLPCGTSDIIPGHIDKYWEVRDFLEAVEIFKSQSKIKVAPKDDTVQLMDSRGFYYTTLKNVNYLVKADEKYWGLEA